MESKSRFMRVVMDAFRLEKMLRMTENGKVEVKDIFLLSFSVCFS